MTNTLFIHVCNYQDSAAATAVPVHGNALHKSKIEAEFEVAKQIILQWNSNSETHGQQILPWEDSPEEAAEYLSAVDEILRLTEDLTPDGVDGEIAKRAESVLQIAMSRLEEEFRSILIRSTVPSDAWQLHESAESFFCCRDSVTLASNDGEIEDFEGSIHEDRESYCDGRRVSLAEDLCVGLIHSDAVVDLKAIANRMIRSGYEKECYQVYSSVRCDVLDECLSILGLEKLSIEEVQKIEWTHLDDKMKKWSRNVKFIIRVLLSCEKYLCDQIFAGSNSIREVCFRETAKRCTMQLLTFGEAVLIARRSPEKLFNILNMYEALKHVLPDLQALFSYDSSDYMYNEANVILEGLGEAAKGTFIEFENAIRNETSKKPIQGGEIHPLTRYVVNYVKLLVDCSDTLTSLLRSSIDRGAGDVVGDGDKEEESPLESVSPLASRLQNLISSLELNLKEKSKLYEDGAMQYIFLMNNIHYIVQKVKDSDLGKLLGDHWVGKRLGQVQQYAMSRLEDEFKHILIRNSVPLDVGQLHGSIRRGLLSLASYDGGGVSFSLASNDSEVEDSESSIDDDRESFCDERRVSLGEDLYVELIHSDATFDLKEIADRMIRFGYEKECCQVYSGVRRDVLDECLSILGLEKLSVEEVQKIEWKHLDDKMKKWSQNVKIVIRVLLSGEKHLCDQIFAGSDLIREVCFTETTKSCTMQLLTFGEAISIARRSPEKLFNILNMYEALKLVLPDLQALFSYDSSDFVYNEAKVIVEGLGEAAKGTIIEFENAVQNETSKKPAQGGDQIHPLTRYVMNYVKLLVDYSDTLDSLLESSVDNDVGDGVKEESQLESVSPLASRLQDLISSLESNLEEKSKLYEDGAMQYIFLMNNIHYIVQKVKDSDLGKLLGDHWVRKRRGQVRQYATSYLRASWSKVLSCLKDEGIGGGGGSSSNVSKVALKERFKNFNSGFEDIYRTQTAWKVTDPQLREELRISISEKVLPAYRFFMGRFGSLLESGRHAGKYIKYSPDDLENHLLDLFEGTPGVLNHSKRKISA